MVTLKDVKVLLSAFTEIEAAKDMRQYVIDCVATGSVATLYANPNILTAFYDEGTQKAVDIQTAIDTHALIPTKSNEKAIKDKMALAVLWLKKYAGKV